MQYKNTSPVHPRQEKEEDFLNISPEWTFLILKGCAEAGHLKCIQFSMLRSLFI